MAATTVVSGAARARSHARRVAAIRIVIAAAIVALWEGASASGLFYRDVIPSLLAIGRALGVLHSTGAPGQRPDAERLAGLTMLAGQAGARIGTLRSFERAQLQASTDGPWELPVLGAVDPPSAVLVRPDGHVAWVGTPECLDENSLQEACSTWFGPARAE